MASDLDYQAPSPQYAKKILRTLFISLLLDLLSFTLILPLFPKIIDHYRSQEASSSDPTILNYILTNLNAFKASFSRPISSRFDVVLLGGALGSLFSLLQAISAPIIGSLSDKYGRRTALLYSMVGNILSVLLWAVATDFPTFLASRVVGGLSEGNVQLAIAIATDVSTKETRGATLALVGVAFSFAFTLGPMMGAFLASKTWSLRNPFATTAAFSLVLLVVETVYLYLKLPETRPPTAKKPIVGAASTQEDGAKTNFTQSATTGSPETTAIITSVPTKRSLARLNATHLFFLLIFSGMEFSLPFMTFDLFSFESKDSGKLLGFIGLTASILQGSFTRRAPPHIVVKTGLIASALSFILLARVQTVTSLYIAAFFLAVTSANVVTGLTALTSFRVEEGERGVKLGGFRSAGQVGRACGPLLFCSLYWWAGREVAYNTGAACMVGVILFAWSGLDTTVQASAKKKVTPITGDKIVDRKEL